MMKKLALEHSQENREETNCDLIQAPDGSDSMAGDSSGLRDSNDLGNEWFGFLGEAHALLFLRQCPHSDRSKQLCRPLCTNLLHRVVASKYMALAS